MLKRFVQLISGDPNKKIIESYAPQVDEINALEPEFEKLSIEQLAAKTDEFRIRLLQGETLDDILNEAYATVREVSKRTIGLRHYDVQLIGGIVLHQGIIAEMRTGEGKTLVATLPLYLNALAINPKWLTKAKKKWGNDPEMYTFEPIEGIPVGRGVHLVTVNDYLARRDARWKAPIYQTLGLSVGVLQMAARTEHGKKAFLVDLDKKSPHEDQNQLEMVPRKLAYAADITYGTNNEYGFDYLRDNMSMNLENRVQRGHYYCIIDEVDNVLIDEARTPLIISGPSHDDSEWYERMAQVVRQLKPEDYEISARDRTITLTEIGETHVEQILGMAIRDPERPEDMTPEQARIWGYLEQALRAEYIYRRNKEYVVQGGKVVIVDDFTGRLMPGRRWSDGLHQAVEAKEGVRIESENVTYATITIQNYFRMYEKLSGMTGTAVTEAEEFSEIYELEAIAIPTNLDYQAERDEGPLVAREAKDEFGYKYTYYVPEETTGEEPQFFKRKDYPDVIYQSEGAKLRAIVQEILRYHTIGNPILVGTTSVENSEKLSDRLKENMVKRLAQTLLIRDAYMEANDRVEDGRQIPELMILNQPLEDLRPSDLRRLLKELELDVHLNPEQDQNIQRLMRILQLSPEHRDRLAEILNGGIRHEVLNARKHTEESQIIARAGEFGAVTIATNMAGRGVDIKLGGELAEEILAAVNRVLRRAGHDEAYEMTIEEKVPLARNLDPEDIGIYDSEIKYFLNHVEDMERVKAVGGLHVIGSERHEARRIDNQLRGRSSRQGDPGSSRFYLSLEDDLMVRFGGQQMEGLLARLRVDEALPIENPLVSRIVEQSQTRVEGANFDVRKHLLEYDDVLNTQRVKIYDQRERIFTKADLNEDVHEMLVEEVTSRVPTALMDEEGPWRLLSWLNQIQPTAPLLDGILPSYAMHLLVRDIRSRHPELDKDTALDELTDLATQALEAEEEHILNSVNNLLDQSEERMEETLEERLETLDAFLEGIGLEDEEAPSRRPQEIAEDLNAVLRMSIRLNAEQTRSLAEDPELVAEDIRGQIEDIIMGMSITRLIGAVERVLKEPLGIKSINMSEHDWDSLGDLVLDAIEEIYSSRTERLIGDEDDPGQITRDLENSLDRLDADTIGDQALLSLLMQMPQGRRATFDKKTHRRVWQRTTRLTYIYLASQLLSGEEVEDVTADVLAHLEKTEREIRRAWGETEYNRLATNRISELDEELQERITQLVQGDGQADLSAQPISDLPDDKKAIVKAELGRTALTKVYRQLMLRVISELWVEYLTQMEALRISISLEAYGQRDPLVMYKNRAFEMFQQLMRDMRMSVVTRMFTFQPRDLSTVQTASSSPAVQAAPVEAEAPQPSKSDGGPPKKSRKKPPKKKLSKSQRRRRSRNR